MDSLGWLLALAALIFIAGMLTNRPHINNTISPTITANATSSNSGGGGSLIGSLVGLLAVALIGLAALNTMRDAAQTNAIAQQAERERAPIMEPTTTMPQSVPAEQPTIAHTAQPVAPAIAPTAAPEIIPIPIQQPIAVPGTQPDYLPIIIAGAAICLLEMGIAAIIIRRKRLIAEVNPDRIDVIGMAEQIADEQEKALQRDETRRVREESNDYGW